MDSNTAAFLADRWSIAQTGGGCTAWEKTFPDGTYIWATHEEGGTHEVPAGQRYLLGFYLGDNSGEAVEERHAMTSEEAVSVARDMRDDFATQNFETRGI